MYDEVAPSSQHTVCCRLLPPGRCQSRSLEPSMNVYHISPLPYHLLCKTTHRQDLQNPAQNFAVSVPSLFRAIAAERKAPRHARDKEHRAYSVLVPDLVDLEESLVQSVPTLVVHECQRVGRHRCKWDVGVKSLRIGKWLSLLVATFQLGAVFKWAKRNIKISNRSN
jgi:hypothetical protein